MTGQKTLWEAPDPTKPPSQQPAALARRTDPATSHRAAEHVVASGTVASHSERIVAWLRANPGAWTFVQIAAGLGLEKQQVNKRLPDLVRKGAIVIDGESVEEYPKTKYRGK